MSAEKKKQMGVLGLIVTLVAVILGGVLFVGAASGWFDNAKVVLDPEYYSEETDFMELDANGYEDLVKARKTFVVFVDQEGCTTADRLREFISNYAKETGIKVYRMMFSEVKNSSLHDQVKYYPSMAIINKGKVAGYLRADADEDAAAYNDYDAFKEWIGQYL